MAKSSIEVALAALETVSKLDSAVSAQAAYRALPKLIAEIQMLRASLIEKNGVCHVCGVRLDPHHEYCPLYADRELGQP